MTTAALNLSEILKNLPRGAWAALWNSRVIAYGADMQQVLTEARERGVPDPLVVKVPDTTESLFL